MALTTEQETFLADFANKGIAEQQEIEDRNAQIKKDQAVKEARDVKEAELQAQADALVEQGLADFDQNVAPTIKPSK